MAVQLPNGGQRVCNRRKRRIPCSLWVGAREHSALVLDLSPSGLFVQTHAKTQRGERLKLRLSLENVAIDLQVEVVRTKSVPQNLLAAAKGGIGVRILDAPASYDALMKQLGIDEPRKAATAARRVSPSAVAFADEPELESGGARFRVHVAQTVGPRSRRIEVCAGDADTASARALEELGDGWKVLRVEAL
jgi:hypothetical protein